MLGRTKRVRRILGALAIIAMAGAAGAALGDPPDLEAQQLTLDDDGRAWYWPCTMCHPIEVGAAQSICAFAAGSVECRIVTYSLCTGATGGYRIVEARMEGCIDIKEIWHWT